MLSPKTLAETAVFISPTFCCYTNSIFPPLFHVYYYFFFQMNPVLDDWKRVTVLSPLGCAKHQLQATVPEVVIENTF